MNLEAMTNAELAELVREVNNILSKRNHIIRQKCAASEDPSLNSKKNVCICGHPRAVHIIEFINDAGGAKRQCFGHWPSRASQAMCACMKFEEVPVKHKGGP